MAEADLLNIPMPKISLSLFCHHSKILILLIDESISRGPRAHQAVKETSGEGYRFGECVTVRLSPCCS